MKQKIKAFILDLLSFDSPQAKVINLVSILLILALVPTGSLQYSPFKCVFKNLILPLVFRGNCPTEGLFADCECPACGLTTAMSRLLHGDLAGAWNHNRLVFAVFLVMLMIIIVNVVRSVRYTKKTRKIY